VVEKGDRLVQDDFLLMAVDLIIVKINLKYHK
jgi:hypothetical protein